MGDIFHCGDNAALVGYLYDECEAGERAAIAAHLAVCATCAAEVAMLSATREQLSAWTPPAASLDFRLTGPATRPAASWWSRPLPAWAQLAAAVAIFAFGLALGAVSARTPAWNGAASTASDDTTAIEQAELTRLDQRLRDIESRSMAAAPAGLDDASREEIATWVRQEINDSELRYRRLLAQTILNINGVRPQEVTQTGPSAFGAVEIARFGQRREE
jgi:anti-sigma factor RsiW